MSSVLELTPPLAVGAPSDGSARVAAPRGNGPASSMRVHAMTYLARDTAAVELRPIDGQALTSFSAGAHIDLELPNGLRRSYSLCNPQGETHRYVIGVKRAADSRGGSRFIYEQLRIGATLKIGFPVNNFKLEEDAPYVVFIAGGIGITPIWCMVQRLVALGNPFELHYASRTRDDAAFIAELTELNGGRGRLINLTFDHEPGATMLDLSAIVARAPAGSHFYACGPSPMLRATAFVARELGVPAQLALEETMACGVGGCWGCVAPIDQTSAQAPGFPGPDAGGSGVVFARVCKEGPVFWAHELRW